MTTVGSKGTISRREKGTPAIIRRATDPRNWHLAVWTGTGWRWSGGMAYPQNVLEVRPVLVMEPSGALDGVSFDEFGGRLVQKSDELGRGLYSSALGEIVRSVVEDLAKEPKQEVYQHVVTARQGDHGEQLVAACGKVWTKNNPDEVVDMGHCPECVQIGKSWTL